MELHNEKSGRLRPIDLDIAITVNDETMGK